jgi:hypothetical protein
MRRKRWCNLGRSLRPLLGLLWKALPDMGQAFTDYGNAVKERAELLG